MMLYDAVLNKERCVSRVKCPKGLGGGSPISRRPAIAMLKYMLLNLFFISSDNPKKIFVELESDARPALRST